MSLSVWRDESHGKPTRDPEEEDEEDEDAQADSGNRQLQPSNQAAATSSGLPPSSPLHASSQGSSPPTRTSNMDEDEEFWKSLDMGIGASTSSAMEDLLSDAPPVPPASSGAPSDMDEDEDMWDIVAEIEKASTSTQEPPSLGVAAGPLPQQQVPDDDWEDMYV